MSDHQESAPGEVTTRVSAYEVSPIPEGLCDDWYRFTLKVEHAGQGRWAVRRSGMCLNRDLKWDYETLPSERTDEWLDEHRFTEGEALEMARKAAPAIVINGWSVPMLLAKYGAQMADSARPAALHSAGVIRRGAKIRIPKGTLIWGTFRGGRKVASRAHCVTAFDSTRKGHEEHGTPYVTWVGSGGYWHHAAIADIEVVSGND